MRVLIPFDIFIFSSRAEATRYTNPIKRKYRQKRMAAEGTDPFVVKLWWSFHDKENLFLIMVRILAF